MPRVMLTEKDKDHNRLVENLRTLQGRRSPKEMAAIIGGGRSKYYSRLDSPENLTYKEIKRLCDYFRIDIKNFVDGKVKVW